MALRIFENCMRAIPDRFREPLQAAALLFVLLVAFFSTPLLSLGRTYYSSADLGQATALTRSSDNVRGTNPLLSDPAVQMQPWLMFDRDELAAGHMPLWNDANGAGVPQLANYQSAVFSPFSVPFYVLGFRAALLVAAFAKLFCLGLFAYLFFRAIDLAHIAALVGAVAFAFSGLNVLLLAYPHSAVAITVPAGLFFAEKAIRARRAWLLSRDSSRRSALGRHWLFAFALCLTCGLLAGHPEPFCFSLLVIGAYVAARLARLWREHSALDPARAKEWKVSVARFAAELALAGLIAAGLAAVQLVPFIEYLSNSTMLAARAQSPAALDIANWPLWFFPDLLGNPSTSNVLAFDLPHPNYEEVNTAYTGGVVVWLAMLGRFVARSRRFYFFLASAVAGVVYSCDLFALRRILGQSFLLSAAPMNRSQILVVFGTCACAALCVDRISAAAFRPQRRSIALAGSLALMLLVVAWLGAGRLLSATVASDKAISHPLEFGAFVARHQISIAASFVAGALALLALNRARNAGWRSAWATLLVVSIFIESGFLLKDYNPTIADSAFFPRTASIEAIQREVGEHRLMVIGEKCLPPESNLSYGLHVAACYDAIWVRDFDALYRRLFGAKDAWRTTEHASETGLKLCGVEYLLTKGEWPGVDALTDRIDPNSSGRLSLVDTSPPHVVRQTFVVESDRLQAVELRVTQGSGAAPSELHAVLESLPDAIEVASIDVDVSIAETQPEDANATTRTKSRSVVLRFAPIEHSRGKSYRLTLRAAADAPRDALFVWSVRKRATQSSSLEALEVDERPGSGRLWFDLSFNLDAFEPVWRSPDYTLYRYTRSPTRYYCVDGAELMPTDDALMERLLSPEFDPARTVLLSAWTMNAIRAPADAGAAQAAQVIDDRHARTRLKVERARPGYLVITRAHYPGWRARVNGVERALLRADFGLSAIQVDAGTSEIELEYDPGSFKIGLWVSGLSALAGAAWIVLARSRAQRRAPVGNTMRMTS